MKSYAGMTRAELERELNSLRATRKATANAAESGLRPHDDDLQNLIYELQVREIELEMQNSELQEARQELEEACDRCTDLYDFAPIGYATLDDKGRIQEINLKGAAMLGKERSYLIGKPFIAYVVKSDTGRFLDHIQRCRQTSEKVSTELGLAQQFSI